MSVSTARPRVSRFRSIRNASIALACSPGWLATFRAAAAPGSDTDTMAVAEFAPLATSVAAMAAMPFLKPFQRRLLTFANAAPILINGADTLVREGVRMEVLDALAVGLSAARGEVYTANITTFLLALGEYLEHQTARKSDRLLRRLLHPEPAPAWVERAGELVQVAGDEVGVGETVVVGVGETIPVDGRIVDGVALVNQAAVTGEDVPVRREKRHRVVAGSVVEEGRVRIETQRVGSDRTTARVASFVQASFANRSDTQRTADDLADKCVWLTLITGALAYALTRDLTRLAPATADIVLVDDRLAAVAEAREISARTMKLIRSSFTVVVGINTVVLGGAVMGWLSPVMSALLHNGTTIGVLLRALAGADTRGNGYRAPATVRRPRHGAVTLDGCALCKSPPRPRTSSPSSFRVHARSTRLLCH
ncbi:MAG: hypothetical protein ACFCUJ_05210 [Thiotrichales bacterium]